MKTVSELDVHKSMILMCILKRNGEKIIQEFSTLIKDVEKMREIMKEHGVEEIGMESTGIYWIPIWRLLQGYYKLKLINPYFIK
jgi:transposase